MADEPKLKSAYDLAMERLKQADRESGVEQSAPLTPKQKRAIAELRQEVQAKLAELEILFDDRRRAAAGDPEKLRQIDEQYRHERQRAESNLESAIDRVRHGTAARSQ